MLNIICRFPGSSTKSFTLPGTISISLMVKLIMVILDLDNTYYLTYNNKIINLDDKSKIMDFFSPNLLANISINSLGDTKGTDTFIGKKIRVTMFFKNLGIFRFKDVNRYSSIGSLYNSYLKDYIKINKVYYNGKLLIKDDNHSLASLGIEDDFGCIVE